MNHWDIAKLAGLMLMFVDHTGAFFFPDQPLLRAIGRGAAPIFLLLVGFASSYRFQWSLLLLALLTSVSDILLTGHLRTQNILVTILLTRLFFDRLEKRGKKIEHPYECAAIGAAWIVSMWVTQYGTFGFLFALCGYMKRRSEHYDSLTRWRIWVLTFAFYTLVMIAAKSFTVLDTGVTALVVSTVGWMLWRLDKKEVKSGPRPLLRIAKFVSVGSGYIYAFHLIALEWLTGIPF